MRRRVIWEQKGRRGRKIDPAWANRRRLLTGRDRLSARGFRSMWHAVTNSDQSGQILAPWIATEELRALLALARTGTPRDRIAAKLYDFLRLVRIDFDRRVAHAGRNGREVVARDRSLPRHRHHQREGRGTEQAAQAGEALRVWVPQRRQPTPPGTVPLHSDPPSSNSTLKIICPLKFGEPL